MIVCDLVPKCETCYERGRIGKRGDEGEEREGKGKEEEGQIA